MNTTVERLGDHTVRMTVTVPPSDVDEAISQAYAKIASQIRIPGFRAGKAPRQMIDTHVGQEAVLAEAHDGLINKAYSEALDRESLRPIAQPDIDDSEMVQPNTQFEFTVEVEVRPEFGLASVENLSVTVPPKTTSEAEIDAQIEHTRERFASLEPVEDRGVQADDFVLISFVGTVDGEEYEGNVVDRYLYEMGRGLMPSEFDEGIIGLEAGATTSVSFSIPDTAENPDFAGKTAAFDVTVHEIKAKVLPEVDDDFAADVGGYDSVAEMRDSLRETMDKAKEVGHKQAVTRAVRAMLAERLQGEAPEAMVESTKGQMIRDFMQGLEQRGMSMPEYLQATGVDMDQIEADIGEQARKVVCEELALEALFRHLGWEVSDEEVDTAVAEIAETTGDDPAQLRKQFEDRGVIAVIHEQIIHRRALEWLTDPANVAVEEAEPATEAQPGESADAAPGTQVKDKE